MLLRSLLPEDEVEARAAHDELTADNFTFLLDYSEGRNWQEYLDYLACIRSGRSLPEGYVPSAFMIAEENGELIGRSSIRYELNDFLFSRGGHIGYAVRPQFRNKGFAKVILRLSLEHLAGVGVDRALVTCNDSNAYSARTIESCGGVLENKWEYGEELTRRYWIDVK